MSSRLRRSTTEIGAAFENYCLTYLNHHLHMSLRRVGRVGDGGIDLRGSWYLPSGAGPSRLKGQSAVAQEGDDNYRRLRVVAQCKAEGKVLGPKVVRELEGVMAHLQGLSGKGKGKERLMSPDSTSDPDGSVSLLDGEERHSDPTMGVVLSQSGFSGGTMTHAAKSRTPLLLVHLPKTSFLDSTIDPSAGIQLTTNDPVLKPGGSVPGDTEAAGAWWNSALSGVNGILGGRVEMKREILLGGPTEIDPGTGEARVRARVGLWYDGRRLGRIGPPLGESSL